MCVGRNEAFDKMFSSDMVEGITGDVKVRGCSRESFQAFLEFMYLGLAGKLMEGADGGELFRLADLYGVDALKEYLLEGIDETCIVAAAVLGSQGDGGGEVVDSV